MKIKTVTVIGANGTMGTNVSAIFASFGAANVYMISRDVEKSKKAALAAAKSVRAESVLAHLIPKDYSELAECVEKSDLIFESVAEELNVKINITEEVAKYIRPDAIICSGTSGLPITRLAECLPEHMRGHYFGVHMFNPPYHMTLCELITTKYTDADVLNDVEQYLKDVLLRVVVRTKDSPAFLANRIGFQFINQALQYAELYKEDGGIDYIDTILGTFTGRAMAPLTTADFVGLDIHKAIVDNIYNNSNDYAHETFLLPQFVKKLIEEGKLGRKTSGGLYKAETLENGKKRLLVYDIETGDYREKKKFEFPFAEEMKKQLKNGNYKEALSVLIESDSKEADICLRFLLNYIVYSLAITQNVAYDIHSADASMATGFNWCPPMAMIEAFSACVDVKALAKEKLNSKTLSTSDIDALFDTVVGSKYDYRPYFKSTK